MDSEAVEGEKSHRFKKVGPNLYRDTKGCYYLLVKRGGKQFLRSLILDCVSCFDVVMKR